MPTSTQSVTTFFPRPIKQHPYRQQVNTPSNIDVDVSTVRDIPTQTLRRGGGNACQSPWTKVFIALGVCALVGGAV